MQKKTLMAVGLLTLLAMQACSQASGPSQNSKLPSEATSQTQSLNQQFARDLPLNDDQDFKDAQQGFIATLPKMVIKKTDGSVVWDLTSYDFLDQKKAPVSVNPSLWRQATLNRFNGLFKVTDRIYQIRGFDISNMTIIEGDTGLIIIDPLISEEVAKAGLELYYQNRPQKPVVAVLYTHSHVDHYGGVKGVTSEEEVKQGKVKIIAPEHFLEDAISENVFAGTAMGRRSTYMYGPFLPRGVKGQVDGGLGKTNSLGTVTLIPPTDIIQKTGEEKIVDGVKMVFQMAPNTEAPAEMLIYFPQFKTLNVAEDATHTLHNLYTLRGAPVRDASKWWKTLNEALKLFGSQTDIVIAQHHWPTWGNERIQNYLASQRDLYKYIHDQSLRLMNSGYTMLEVAEKLKLPAGLSQRWFNRSYYGSVNHNAKAVYQRYLGWYDSNPANLFALPPEEASKHYVEFMGGSAQAMKKARKSFEKGDYRWVAMVMNHVVFADPSNKEARQLQAEALEQLGYQSENPTWRNEFLMGAYELRNGVPNLKDFQVVSTDTLKAMPVDMLLDYLGIRLNADKAEGKSIKINWAFTDTGEKYALSLENGALIYTANTQFPQADANLTLTREGLNKLLDKSSDLEKEIASGNIKVEGDSKKMMELLSYMDEFDPSFNIVTP